MKTLKFLAPLLFAAVALGGQEDQQPRSYVIGISPFLEASVKDTVYRKIIAFVIDDLPLQSKLRIYDAYDLQTITEIEVPSLQVFRSAKTRANQFAAQIQKLKAFLAADHKSPGGLVDPLPGAIRFPQFCDFLHSTTPAAENGQAIAVLVLGSPLYVDAKEPFFSMSNGYFPSDGHLRVGRDQSVYGVADRTNSLRAFQVHFAWFGDPWVTDLHREKVARFWQLFLKAQGASLNTFSGDLATAFKNARLPATEQPHELAAELDPGQTKLEMLRVTRDVALQDWITRDAVNSSRLAPSKTVGPMKIGIRWQGNWDLDLYASAKPGSETLFFHHTRCPEGYYYKDHRSSPGREYEFIEFTAPVDVFQLEAMVNFYKGSAPDGAAGEVRIEFDKKIYSGSFLISATRGNEGRLSDSERKYWTQINIPALLHLNASEQTHGTTEAHNQRY